MAKGKRKSNRRPVDPRRVAQAKQAKRLGLISKRAKVAGGKLSRAVEKKTEALRGLGLVSDFMATPRGIVKVAPPSNVAIKAKKSLVQAAQALDFNTLGNRIVAPSDQKSRVTRALKKGKLGGVKRLGPGQLEIVPLASLGITDFEGLRQRLLKGNFSGTVKNPDEFFNFYFYGTPSRNITGFRDDKELYEYLQRYRQIGDPDGEVDLSEEQDAFFNFELVKYQRDFNWHHERALLEDREGNPYQQSRRRKRQPKGRKHMPKTPEQLREYERQKKAKQRATYTPEKKKAEHAKRTERRRKNKKV
jgi:hypothetical protein